MQRRCAKHQTMMFSKCVYGVIMASSTSVCLKINSYKNCLLQEKDISVFKVKECDSFACFVNLFE